MRFRLKNQIISVAISGFSKKGSGTGFFDEKKIEVPFTATGDVVQAKIIKKRKGAYLGCLQEIIKPSEHRIEPKCLHFGQCGGCRWQHLPYEEQLKEKQARLDRLFGNLICPEPIIPCRPPWNYRNKMEFTFSQDSEGRHYLGLVLALGKGKVFNLSECHLCSPWFVQIVQQVKRWWEQTTLHAYHPHRNTGTLRTLTVREGVRTGDKMVILTVSGNPDYAISKKDLSSFVDIVSIGDNTPSVFLNIHQIMKGHPTQIHEMHLAGPEYLREKMSLFDQELVFNISPGSFFQPNTAGAEKLYEKALELADIKKTDVVFDLYCGTGTLGLLAASRAARVVGVEIIPGAILDARENAKMNGFENIEFFKGDVAKILDHIEQDRDIPRPHVVMIDPPRAGLEPKAIQQIGALGASKIVYISCNPESQAENILSFLQIGYRPVACQPVDQFPHTVHIENIVVLKKINHAV